MARPPVGMVVGEASKLCDKSTDAKLGSFTHYAAFLSLCATLGATLGVGKNRSVTPKMAIEYQ